MQVWGTKEKKAVLGAPESSLLLYLFICKHADVGGGLLAEGVLPVRQDGAVEEGQVFALRVMERELGTAQGGL